MGIVARVMAWHITGKKVRMIGITATIRPSKSGHKTTPCDAHPVAMGFSKRLWYFAFYLAPLACAFLLIAES